jgi:hypothetical protein
MSLFLNSVIDDHVSIQTMDVISTVLLLLIPTSNGMITASQLSHRNTSQLPLISSIDSSVSAIGIDEHGHSNYIITLIIRL